MAYSNGSKNSQRAVCVCDLNGQKGYGLSDLDISNGQMDIKTMKKN